MGKYVCNIAEIRKDDVLKGGGKAANLGEMIDAGFPVPGGFVVLTDSYKRFLEKNNLEKDIKVLINKVKCNDSDINKAVKKIKNLFEMGEIPEDIKKEIDETYKKIGSPTVAIRSSATAEDMPGMSFAGQYSTYLNVKGLEDVYKYIKKCWASLWNERAVSYRSKQNMVNSDLAHGIVVQKLIKSEKSGIIFTANPVNGKRDEVLINSSWGLGEAIVGGEVNPDQWVISKKTFKVTNKDITTKKVKTVRREKGIELVPVPKEKQEISTLNDEEIQELTRLSVKVEEYFNSPQDVEWAFESGKFYLVQTRPVTTLYPMYKTQKNEDDFRIYVNLFLYSQSMKEPFTPMGFNLVKQAYANLLNKFGTKNYKGDKLWWFHNFGGRAYADVTNLLRSKKNVDKLKNNKRNDKDPLTTKALIQVIERNKDEIMDKSKAGIKVLSKLNLRLFKVLIEASYKSIYATINPKEARRRSFSSGDNKIEELKKEKEKLKTLEEKLSFVEKNSHGGIIAAWDATFYTAITLTYMDKAEKIMKKYLDDVSDLQYIEKSVPYNVTTEMGMSMLNIAKKLDGKGMKASEKDKDIRKFLKQYGDKSSYVEADVASTTWSEEPEYVLDLINSFIENKSYNEEMEKFHKDREEAQKAIERIKENMEKEAGKRKAKKIVKILTHYREMFGLRELPKYYLTKVLSIVRFVLIDIGEKLVKAGRLEDKMDVFYVNIEDIRSKKDLKEIVKVNKEEYIRETNRPMPPRVITSTGESIYSVVEKAGENAFAGVAVSPGVYEGRIKVLNSPVQGQKLEKGDILVTAATNPAWTPLFLKIGALIMETGGPISHGSVVAREYGVPAVVGVAEATSMLKDGQIVKVNGETGVIELKSS
ncbi:PEP/pyruvate-binding domain-containing protein [Herbivorax sp. ANBcel31]|uniref:PEP/pyruvate-binding domain-containing protein n=1 Tax=Herbivorax sp. ANBcel31 TaxID=3069754 RepID=UPI0027B61075|nr:PEP/pyruvate-binding domain-containing protein [Herbivorax sp. ANBcel31]MDQ2086088.1 PEP/pyruvate-binding domain-containing protein [Herbivorax sp. ANBcel31]